MNGHVLAVERLSGQSHVSWRVEREGLPAVALRIEPREGILPPYDLAAEATLLHQLRDAGIPVPKVLGQTDQLEPWEYAAGSCLALEWIDGEPLSQSPLDASRAAIYCELLRRVHTLDWRATGLDWLPLPPSAGAAIRERAQILDRLELFGLADTPHIRRLRDALDGGAPEPQPPMLVHGDVNFGNVILQSQTAVLLDWEQAHLGDPLSDWGRLAAEDLLGNLDLTLEARDLIGQTVRQYGRGQDDLHYWTLHQLYKHSSATGALTVQRGWDMDRIAAMYEAPTDQLLSPSPDFTIWP